LSSVMAIVTVTSTQPTQTSSSQMCNHLCLPQPLQLSAFPWPALESAPTSASSSAVTQHLGMETSTSQLPSTPFFSCTFLFSSARLYSPRLCVPKHCSTLSPLLTTNAEPSFMQCIPCAGAPGRLHSGSDRGWWCEDTGLRARLRV
jgi:hypothetical protein